MSQSAVNAGKFTGSGSGVSTLSGLAALALLGMGPHLYPPIDIFDDQQVLSQNKVCICPSNATHSSYQEPLNGLDEFEKHIAPCNIGNIGCFHISAQPLFLQPKSALSGCGDLRT
ncbi:hypothetical protein B0H19DRAFT_1075912 [Mycena capillaripes]|nr:hypothetical protein B0H19DRAFT_1075912 [Mycena capillaripes]